AGGMLLAALLDVGAPHAAIDDTIRSLGLRDVRVQVRAVTPSGIAGTHIDITTNRGSARPASEMRATLERAELSDTVRARSLDAFDRLVGAEAVVHGVDPATVVLHEVGDDDTLIDICGSFRLLELLGVELVVCAPLPMGRGVVPGDHGP